MCTWSIDLIGLIGMTSRRLLVATVFLLYGCIDDHLVHCPSPRGEVACAVSSVCVASGCASSAEAEACIGASENETCMVDTIAGRCIGGACRTPICGNGITEGGEQCDDGNLASGDGCAANCASNETCGNGVTDFVGGEQCDDGNIDDGDACRRDCTVPRCGDGVVDAQNGEACDDGSANSNTPGAACRLNCQALRCGDGVLDPGEVCEDGNVTAGDGCSSDCRSNETCGNGVLDGILQEECDDAAIGLSGDGCTARCTIETPDWGDITPKGPPGLAAYALTYDSFRGRLVMFGGRTNGANGLSNATWELMGSTWLEITVPVAPPPRWLGAIAFDEARHRVVLFGGEGQSLLMNDTWEYDGITWRQISTANAPSARRSAAMVYDPSRNAVVLFGGWLADGSPSNETWQYNGTNWTLLATTNPPSARSSAAIAYDPAATRIVLAGGAAVGSLTDSYQLIGSTWSPLGTGPSGDISATYDASRGHVVVLNTPAGTAAPVTYELVGSTWSQLSPATNITSRQQVAIAYVPGCSCVTTFGGNGVNGAALSDTWRFASGAWTVMTPLLGPQGYETAVTYDSRRGRVIAFGGKHLSVDFTLTWELVGDSWLPAASLPAAEGPYNVMAYDSQRDRTVLFGAGSWNDTWEYDGATWTQKFPATPPPVVKHPVIGFDEARARIVMFGGTVSSSYSTTTYEYDGVDWVAAAPAVSPPGRVGAALAYDARRKVLVLFGGVGAAGGLGDTWEYDGQTWSQRTFATSPPARSGHVFAFDAVRGHVLLFGGLTYSGTYLDDTWEYDGTTWRRVLTASSPTPRIQSSMAYDAGRARTILFGGQIDTTPILDTWSFRWSSLAVPRDDCQLALVDSDGDGLAGCSDPDCWGRCAPQCPPYTTCDPTRPRCGDGTCTGVEDYLLCPADCVAP